VILPKSIFKAARNGATHPQALDS